MDCLAAEVVQEVVEVWYVVHPILEFKAQLRIKLCQQVINHQGTVVRDHFGAHFHNNLEIVLCLHLQLFLFHVNQHLALGCETIVQCRFIDIEVELLIEC